MNRYNFIIANGRATLVDFDTATKCEDEDALKEEVLELAGKLCDESGRGGEMLITDGGRVEYDN